jgi:hypothetical protein
MASCRRLGIIAPRAAARSLKPLKADPVCAFGRLGSARFDLVEAVEEVGLLRALVPE